MQRVIIRNKSRPEKSPIFSKYCDTFYCKFLGLMGQKNLQEHEGILLVESSESRINSAIHMLFMNFDLAIIWVNANNRVVDVTLARKWHLVYIPQSPACYILETHPCRMADFSLGDVLTIDHA